MPIEPLRVFVTGATGFIGQHLVRKLLSAGHSVHALYRTESKALPLRMEGVILYPGDLLDKTSIERAISGCTAGYHLAAFAGFWEKERNTIFRYNVEGTMNVVDAAARGGVERMVVTSTAGVLEPSVRGVVDENSPPPAKFFTPYEASKCKVEQWLLERKDQMPEIVIVNPTRVFGPGILSESNGVTRMISRYLEGRWRFLPGSGHQMGNYVFVDDVVTGMMLAMEHGRSGERYILGGEDISYRELFEMVDRAGGKRRKLYPVPGWMLMTAASAMKLGSRISGASPLIVPGLVRKFMTEWRVSSGKARQELGYHPGPVEEGVKKIVSWLGSTGDTTGNP